jgi:hypothetical protein
VSCFDSLLPAKGGAFAAAASCWVLADAVASAWPSGGGVGSLHRLGHLPTPLAPSFPPPHRLSTAVFATPMPARRIGHTACPRTGTWNMPYSPISMYTLLSTGYWLLPLDPIATPCRPARNLSCSRYGHRTVICRNILSAFPFPCMAVPATYSGVYAACILQ